MSTLYIRLAGIAVFVLAVLGGYFYVKNLQSNLAEAQAQVLELQGKYKTSQEDLTKATESAAALDAARKSADEARAQVQRERDAAMAKLRGQKPPVDCKAAIQWSIEQKGDLSW